MKASKHLLLLFSFLLAAQLHAQLSLGIQGGYTDAWQAYGDVDLPEDAQTHISGYHISALAYFQINKYLHVGAEPGFIKRGAACVPGWNGGANPVFEGDTKFLLSYVEVPLFVSGKIPLLKNKLEVFGKVGYGPSYMTTAFREEMDLGNLDPVTTRTEMDLGEFSVLNRWDHGIYGGLGLGFNFGNNQIFVASDYYMGFKDAERFNTSKNRGIDFSIGYLIKL
jgi:hypothetical protein